jgi:protoporphyrin/coproporphyrin ferrochelatase
MVETGVLVMAYGTPASLADVEPYYTHIRHGRPPSPEQLADLKSRYEALGGTSGFAEITAAQAEGIEKALEEREPGRFGVYLGQKHAEPFVEDAVARMRADGIGHAVALVLAPHYAKKSVGQYLERAEKAAEGEISLAAVETWHLAEGYLDFLADAVSEALRPMPARTRVLFTAHSLPLKAVEDDDYPGRLRETAHAVAERLGLDDWAIGWQSEGATPDPWLGPDILVDITATAGEGVDGLVVCACGFVADHLEVLYDLDIEARQAAEAAGLDFARTRMPNDDPSFLSALADVVVDAAEGRAERWSAT